ncbi:MAG: DRTGG domain-containing protein [Anaerolineaceae bacterium]
MNLQEIVNSLHLTPLTTLQDFSTIEPSCGYASDLLSCVMAGAAHQSVWVTLQAHVNIVAVASLLDLSAIIITENAQPDASTIQKANEERINIFSTPEPTFAVVGKLWELGLHCQQQNS